VLKQRNALLKSGRRLDSPSVRSTLEVWDESLAKAGAAVGAARLAALGALVPHARKRYEEVAGGGALELAYESSWVPEDLAASSMDGDATAEIALLEAMRAGIAEMRVRELERGVSLVGPHRDDVVVRLAAGDGSSSLLDARMYASQGDQRTAALGLKLGEHDLLTDALGRHPILLLDDVFSELDPERRRWLAGAVRELGQTIVSSAEPGAAEAAGADRILSVVGGRLEEA
jgi:DNA replication and repair protein RecF